MPVLPTIPRWKPIATPGLWGLNNWRKAILRLIGQHSESTDRLLFEDENAVVDRARVFKPEFL
jgi:hypothetical protein